MFYRNSPFLVINSFTIGNIFVYLGFIYTEKDSTRRKKRPVVWVVGDSYVLRAVEKAQGSSLGLDDIVDLHWKVLSENVKLNNFKDIISKLCRASTEEPSMVIMHLGAYDFVEDPDDNFQEILRSMGFHVIERTNCRLVW